MENQITIPVSQTHSDDQLQSFLMALIHGYGLTAVLDAMYQGLLIHYDQDRVEYQTQGPILDSINVARTVAEKLLEEEQSDDTRN
ncbi:hypothetical protein SPB21_03980 [Leptothoe sp. ISB3NOV94-8A]